MPRAPRSHPRGWMLLGGALLGVTASFLVTPTTGCIYHDTCIKVTSAGWDLCRNVALAKMWPVGGSFDEAEPILRADGSSPRGCRCYNDAENQVFDDKAPECQYEGFLHDLAQAAREECQALVPAGYDHNCWTTTGPQASIVEGEYGNGPGSCIGNCEYGSAPIGGSCPSPSPYECATGGYGDEGCGSEGSEGDAPTTSGDSGLDETGSDTTGGLLGDLDAFVDCHDLDCEIDEAFARQLYLDPSPLLEDSARLVYDTKRRRHVFHRVDPGSLPHALGLRTGDVLETIDDTTISDLDSALRTHARLADADVITVEVKRGPRWLTFTYTFVR